jgi:hypothetical protein
MHVLAHKAALDAEDVMAIAYYMLLQDRVDEGLRFFERVQPERLATQVQYDYFRAYIAMYREDPGEAKDIAIKYSEYPVKRWRDMFAEVRAQIAEISGTAEEHGGARDQNRLAGTEPRLEFTIEGDAIAIRHENLDGCDVSIHPVDIEMLFTRNPFDPARSGVFAGIEAAWESRVPLERGAAVTEVPIPEEFRTQHVAIEVESAGLRRSEIRYAAKLAVQTIERYGQILVTDNASNQPLPKVYVKVFAKVGGNTVFYKDGYTDLRGRFDYASSSTLKLDDVSEFGILVLSEEHGARVLAAAPPVR